MQEKIEINISIMIKLDLSFEKYFILDTISRSRQCLLEEYVIKYGTFDKSIFSQLIEQGYLFPIDSQITYEKLKLTEKYFKDFELTDELNFDKMFNELREIYPKKIPGRVLQGDITRCKKKYKEIVNNEEKHKLLIECTKLYLNDLKRNGKKEFVQMLSTYLNQKTFESYIDEVGKINNEEKPSYDTI